MGFRRDLRSLEQQHGVSLYVYLVRLVEFADSVGPEEASIRPRVPHETLLPPNCNNTKAELTLLHGAQTE
jgi:hypothetical protein